MASRTASSSLFWRSWRVGIIVVVIILEVLAGYNHISCVDALNPTCSGRKVSASYSKQVTELVLQLEHNAPYSKTRSAAGGVGSVAGEASCGERAWDADDCTGCLGDAVVDLSVDCKGRESGSSTGFLGRCKMNFHRAS
ncbi:unnamed protein product [Linum trigynum]|uniref:Gnk2-homologous domain-containing protein n=1 Tax=Linum trigynum TaxID=586398 RepID=A0AAV2FS65_9ROSI